MESLTESSTMSVQPQDSATVNRLITDLQSSDDTVRGAAWQSAAPLGALAVKPLVQLMTHQDFEIARAAKRALWKIVRHAGRPRAARERKAVQTELVSSLKSSPVPVCREVIWMLSEIGDSATVEPLTALLVNVGVREDARCALERIPTSKATRALDKSLKNLPEDFRPALANSLRVRGRKIKSYPGQKLVPVKSTTVGNK